MMETKSNKSSVRVNETHILVLKEVDRNLQVLSVPIEDCSFIVNEINAAVENTNKTMLDIQSLFFNNFNGISNSYYYLYPYSYDSSYISGAVKPKRYSYDDYKKMLDKTVEEKSKCMEDKSKEKIVTEAMKSLKCNYARLCIRYIKQQQMYKAFQNAENSPSVKMYSCEAIGWTNFVYKITDDLNVCVYTNLGYGNSSYFTLTVSYKDIIIAPFSHIAKYYFANMTDIIRCTRDYIVDKDSWNPMLEFVRDFTNHSLSNPESFIEHYLMNEIDEMMKGLRNIMSYPEDVINMFRNQNSNLSEYHYLRLISPMSDDEKRRFEVYRDEMPVIFKSEKLTQAINILERLRELGQVYSKIEDYVDEILTMVSKLSPEIDKTIKKIQEAIEKLTKEKESKEEKRDNLQSKVDKFSSELNELLSKLPEDSNWEKKVEISKHYEEEHPDYVSMKGLLINVKDEILKISYQIYSRNSLVYRLSSCADNIGRCLLKSA